MALNHFRSFATATNGRRARPLGGILPIIGLIFGLGLAAGAILHPPRPMLHNPMRPAHDRAMSYGYSWRMPSGFDPQVTYPAEVLRVIDGDTFEARLRIWRGFEVDTKVRLRAIDAPELHARCASEYLKAEAARTALQSILSAGGVTVSQIGPDKYRGRIDAAAATRDTPDVAAALLKGGWARSYDGGRRGTWC